jgi:hypothetical protein
MLRIQGLVTRLYRWQIAVAEDGDRGLLDEAGSSIVEMALTLSVLFMLVFGIIFMSMALYTYNCIGEAAREATRYAVIRGSGSCTVLSTFPNCNLNPTTSGTPLQDWVRGLGYPFAASLTVTPTWWSPSSTSAPTWTTACVAATCNAPGNMVKVVVSYDYPLAIPFWKNTTLSMASTSQMVISE